MSSQPQKQEVLFQRLANTWYAITEKDGEMLFTAIPDGLNPIYDKLEIIQILEDSNIVCPLENAGKLEQVI